MGSQAWTSSRRLVYSRHVWIAGWLSPDFSLFAYSSSCVSMCSGIWNVCEPIQPHSGIKKVKMLPSCLRFHISLCCFVDPIFQLGSHPQSSCSCGAEYQQNIARSRYNCLKLVAAALTCGLNLFINNNLAS